MKYLFIFLIVILIVGCGKTFDAFKPYSAATKMDQTAKNYSVNLSVMTSPDRFTIYSKTVPIKNYIENALKKEFQQAGYSLVDKEDKNTLKIIIHVDQFDLGYEYSWWNSLVFYVGYSTITVGAVTSINAEVELPDGRRFSRLFASTDSVTSDHIWLGPIFPLFPIRLSGKRYNEEDMISYTSTTAFSDMVSSITDLLRTHL